VPFISQPCKLTLLYGAESPDIVEGHQQNRGLMG